MKQKKVSSKVIDALFQIKTPTPHLRRVVYISNSIEGLILDMQELFPAYNITRHSVISWKFMTIVEYKTFKQENNNTDEIIEKEC